MQAEVTKLVVETSSLFRASCRRHRSGVGKRARFDLHGRLCAVGDSRGGAGGATMPYEAGQYFFLNIAELGTLAFHPFTISSAPSDPRMTFHIKAGSATSWTRGLYVLADHRETRFNSEPSSEES